MCATPSSCAICFRLSGWLAYCSVEVREITFRSPIPASLVRIRSCMPATKYSLSGSRERFSNGSTAIDLAGGAAAARSEEHTSELQSLMRISYAVFCLKKKKTEHSDVKSATNKQELYTY